MYSFLCNIPICSSWSAAVLQLRDWKWLPHDEQSRNTRDLEEDCWSGLNSPFRQHHQHRWDLCCCLTSKLNAILGLPFWLIEKSHTDQHHVTLIFKVIRKGHAFVTGMDSPTQKTLETKKSIVFGQAQPKLVKVTYNITWPWVSRSFVEVTHFWLVGMDSMTKKH